MCRSREEEIKNLLKETGILEASEEKYYIYGAANNAKWLLQMFETIGIVDKIKGFLVTDITENPKILEGLSVFDVHEFKDKKVNVLVPHAGVYKREIFSLLDELEYEKVYSILNLIHFMKEEKSAEISDSYMQKAEMWIGELKKSRTEDEKNRIRQLKEKIVEIQKAGNPDFGGFKFYQGFEEIEVQGIRPTRYRILRYGLNDILKENYKVLDIGCNSGFLDMAVSDQVYSITGVEYDSTLVSIAECVRKYLKIDNCVFVNADFNEWYKAQKEKYDVIFSFAIHHWLNLKPEEYVERLDDLLKVNGVICMESHDLARQKDCEYEECIELLLNRKYVIQKQEDIMDDGITHRNFTILYKR